MRIYPALHYTMGGLWVDYNLMSNLDGLFVIGEANFSDHGGNRLGASALMQGLADGYFVLPYTIGDYLARHMGEKPLSTDHPGFQEVESGAYYGAGYEDVKHRRPSIRNARRLLNWEPEVDLEESVGRTLDFFLREHLDGERWFRGRDEQSQTKPTDEAAFRRAGMIPHTQSAR